jgi:hypothetical protein
MVSTAWVAGQLNPYARWIKLAAILLVCAALFSAGWVVNGWRLGEASATKEAARQSALNARAQAAITDALAAVTRAHTDLEKARATNARLVREASQHAPTAPAFDCRNLPLPDLYLEDFRK